MNWTIEQLRYFVAASEEGSISAAARRLGKAQSAVSTAISLLEADLGFELFDRSRRNARLTDQGEVMLLEAKELLRQAEGLNHRANALAYGEQPQLSLALDEALPYQAVSELMRDLAHQFAYLELTLLNGTSTEVAEYVEKQRADIGFHVDRGAISSALGHKYIGAAVQGVFVAGDHPLAHRDQVTRGDLAKYRQILLQMDDITPLQLSPSIWRADSSYVIASVVVDKLGWAVLPIDIAEYEDLHELRCDDLGLPQLPVRMLWRFGREPNDVMRWCEARFAELLRASAPQV
ncbi:LysR family transcriptional regulator [Pandoraea apista]|uniref:LysR family transcriptional regulator n=1 Tax=Pandoraea apista TaxID=93218 RepID=UPI00058A9E86|nr:LysR family transcriptional regulator [Pandoraea apista]AJE97344.1 LysR family transcriptional regulator [Pandoraea apista]AKH71315.1 LysR family transcriptional regulator [Pandoraea apista]AKI63587.1 LysR family transcriptional regulator [Pandoraea apista]